MAEDNKDEWSGGQPARPGDDANATSGFTNDSGYAGNGASAESGNTGNADWPAGNTDSSESGDTQSAATQDTKDINATPTEVFTTGYRPDSVNSADTTSGNSGTSGNDSSPYRPAPEYGAYGPLPDHIGNAAANNYGNGNAPYGTDNGSGSSAPVNNGPASSPSMPWNGIFGSSSQGQNPNAGQNGDGGNQNNGYGNAYNTAPVNR